MAKKARYNPPEGYNPETATPEMRAIVESLQAESDNFHREGQGASLGERVRNVSTALSKRGYKADKAAIRAYFQNIGEAGYEGGKTGLFIIGPKTAIIGAKLGALAGAFGVKAERIKQGRGRAVQAAEKAFEKAEDIIRKRLKSEDSPKTPDLGEPD